MRGERFAWVKAALLLGATLGMGCSSPGNPYGEGGAGGSGGIGGSGGASGEGGSGGAQIVPHASSSLMLEVLDVDTNVPISNAVVWLEDAPKERADGIYYFDELPVGDLHVQVKAAGYASAGFVMPIMQGVVAQRVVLLKALGPPLEIDTESGGVLISDGVTVTFPPHGFVDADGKPVTGTAIVHITPYDVRAKDGHAIPGDLVGKIEGEEEQTSLKPVGIADISVFQNNKPLKLAEGKKTGILLPLAEEEALLYNDGDTIPFWRFDPAQALWIKDGEGVIEASPTEPSKKLLHGTVSSLKGNTTSTECACQPAAKHCVNVTVYANGVPTPGITFTATASGYDVASGTSGLGGQACISLTENTSATLCVKMCNGTVNGVGSASAGSGQTQCGQGPCGSGTVNVTTPCTIGQDKPCGHNNVGACKWGAETCTICGWSVCTGAVWPSSEFCNGVDDDCNGTVDDPGSIVGANAPCTTNLPGICSQGKTTCAQGQLVCGQTVFPQAETCNGVDDDCDGVIDGDAANAGGQCSTGMPGTCGIGTFKCQDGKQVCKPAIVGPEQCNGADDDCNGIVDEGDPGGNVACSTGMSGLCADGIRHCVNGSLQCSPSYLSAEVCDGIDNDCNGVVDESNPALGSYCNTGAQGICSAGTVTGCSAGKIICTQNKAASAETCNGLDDNCNGTSDENNPGGGQACPTGQSGACSAGTTLCAGGATVCIPNKHDTEVCNGIDDDCNTLTDEGNPGGGIACETGKPGICSSGITNCQAGSVVCVQSFTALPYELCNGKDDNCNGSIDEGQPEKGKPCQSGQLGECAAGTISACVDGSPVCTAIKTPTAEICDGLDNNCDGHVDDNNPGGGKACNTASTTAICQPGTETCVGGQIVCVSNIAPDSVTDVCNFLDDDCDGQVDEDAVPGSACTVPGTQGVCAQGSLNACNCGVMDCAQVNFPTQEVCDGVDNDCNGDTDEADPLLDETCETGVPGLCGQGVYECMEGSLVCIQTVFPATVDACNGLDDDCDGDIDEDNPVSGQPCNDSGLYGACMAGTTVCGNGSIVCQPNILPGQHAETCNGIDDDCDGYTDNSLPEIGTPCTTTGQGVCADGIITDCANGVLTCTPNVEPSLEVCDGLDNDCNGLIDETFPQIEEVCSTGNAGACDAGHYTCTNGVLACEQVVFPMSDEICNGADDDCDGAIDEEPLYDGDPCVTGMPGACSGGINSCQYGVLECIPDVQLPGTPETCNGIDDDCNGLADDGDPEGGAPCSTGMPGICSSGTMHCVDGAVSCVQNVAAAPQENCATLVDDDCDGFLTGSNCPPTACPGQGNIWHFGANGGLDFSTTPPMAIWGPLWTWEGTAVLSDCNGSLLVSSDGANAYDRNGNLMPNGSALGGDSSSLQSALLLPEPGANNAIVHHFAVMSAEGNLGPLRYSRIDMTLNGGLGDVDPTQTAVDLSPGVILTERLIGVKHSNQSDYWVLAHEWGTNQFLSYHVAPGLIDAPVQSYVGAAAAVGMDFYGALAASKDGTRLATPFFGSGLIEVYDFDNATGVVSNPITFAAPCPGYGMELSPNGDLLYLVCYSGGGIYQYDISSSDPAVIAASQTSIASSSNAQIKRGPDGRIYACELGGNNMLVIPNPNVPGIGCGFTSIPLSEGSQCLGGLPNVVPGLY